jgi:ribonuclease HII
MSPRWRTEERVAGVDEAGRGPLAGPVVAAAVILPRRRAFAGLEDSKAVDQAERELLAARIRGCALAWGIGWAEAAEIDALNILEATLLAMRRALLALPVAPRLVRVDGNRAPSLEGLPFRCGIETVLQGDRRDAAVAAASVLAKTWRDAWMVAACERHPGYDFAVHKGYGTAVHLKALSRLGPCPLHRRSFEPVRSAS